MSDTSRDKVDRELAAERKWRARHAPARWDRSDWDVGPEEDKDLLPVWAAADAARNRGRPVGRTTYPHSEAVARFDAAIAELRRRHVRPLTATDIAHEADVSRSTLKAWRDRGWVIIPPD